MTSGPRNPDTDVVVIGSGHNGLTCAAYLAKSGLTVTVIEGEDRIGGGTATRDLIRPGFLHNTCGNFFRGFENYPILRDLDLAARGFDYIVPEVQQAYCFADDRALVIHRDTDASKQSIARFSTADADSWAGLSDRFTRALPLLVATEFTAPPGAGRLGEEALDSGLIDEELADELGVPLLAQLPLVPELRGPDGPFEIKLSEVNLMTRTADHRAGDCPVSVLRLICSTTSAKKQDVRLTIFIVGRLVEKRPQPKVGRIGRTSL